MAAELSRLQSPAAIEAALDECCRFGQTGFLVRYGFEKSSDFLVRDGRIDQLRNCEAIVGAAFRPQLWGERPLEPADFHGGEATFVTKIQRLGFKVVRIGEDWCSDEIRATVASYFEMLRLEAAQQPYSKTKFNAQLRQQLRGRSSTVLHDLELPFVRGYKSQNNAQPPLRQAGQQLVSDRPERVSQDIDAMGKVRMPHQQYFIPRWLNCRLSRRWCTGEGRTQVSGSCAKRTGLSATRRTDSWARPAKSESSAPSSGDS